MFLIDYLLELKWPLTLVAIGLLAALWRIQPKKELLYLSLLFSLSLGIQTRFGKFHDGRLVHSHDLFHYQIGSKYFKELGYQGLYAGTTQALQELEKEQKTLQAPRTFRDLSQKMGEHLPATHWSTLSTKNQFSPTRWEEFKTELSEWNKKFQPNWQSFVQDAGYNPSPLVTLWGLLLNPLFSIKNPHLFVLPDLISLFGCFFLLWRTFGLRIALYAGCAFFLFPPGRFAAFDWIGGSFLRLPWMFWLTLGITSLYQKRYGWAGFALALSAAERTFPGAWLACTGMLLAIAALEQRKNPTLLQPRLCALKNFTLTATLTLSLTFIATYFLIGPDCWAEFLQHIRAHGSGLYTNHFGWGRAITFHPHMAEVSFSNQNMSTFATWGARLLQREDWILYRSLKIALLAALFFWGWKTTQKNLPLAAAWLGGAVVFFFSMPAQYYLVGLLPLFAVSAAPPTEPPFYFRTLLAGLIVTITAQLAQVPSWSISSIVIIVALAYWLAYWFAQWLHQNRAWRTPCHANRWALLTATSYGVLLLFYQAAFPDPAALATKARVQAPPGLKPITRSFLVSEGFEVKDSGYILKPGDKLLLQIPPTRSPLPQLLQIRTDRFFKGRLELQTSTGTPLHSWNIAAQGWLFDTLSTPLPTSHPHLQLEWKGEKGTDIALFSVWLQPAPTP